MAQQRPRPLRGSVTQNFIASRSRHAGTTGSPRFFVRLFTLIISLILIIGTSIWLWHIKWPQRQIENLAGATMRISRDAGFAVADIAVEGGKQTGKEELAAALNIPTGAPIFSFDPKEAIKKIEKLPWVSDAVVLRRLPGTIYVRIKEREPMARWQREGKTVVIDSEGKELEGARLDKFSALPLVVGEDAPPETSDLLTSVKDFPTIKNLLEAAVRVSGRRWDLHLRPKLLVKLPEHNIGGALQRLSQLIREQKILERDIVAVDLRLQDRLFLEKGKSTN